METESCRSSPDAYVFEVSKQGLSIQILAKSLSLQLISSEKFKSCQDYSSQLDEWQVYLILYYLNGRNVVVTLSVRYDPIPDPPISNRIPSHSAFHIEDGTKFKWGELQSCVVATRSHRGD